MKEILKSWIFWLVVAILAIVTIVLYFTIPVFGYACAGFAIGALAGFITGLYVAKK
jgi:hypothetical protein